MHVVLILTIQCPRHQLMPLGFDSYFQVELIQTLEECKMSDYIPESTSDGLREILLGCLDHSSRE